MRVDLVPFPSLPPVASAVSVHLARLDTTHLTARYVVEGAERLRLPSLGLSERRDALWRTTCFEAFVMGAGPAYAELNFSPSGAWAAYSFTARRAGREDAPLAAPPQVRLETTGSVLSLTAHLDLAVLPAPPVKLGLTAVLEGRDGALGYWALAHPNARPDFHDPAGFLFDLTTLEPS